MDTKKTGEFITALRKEKGLTQAELAELLHVSDKAVSRWETGRGFPDIGNIENLSECLDTSAAEIIRGERISDTLTREDLHEITSRGMSITGELLSRTRVVNTLAGFIAGLLITIIAVIHLLSPAYIYGPDGTLGIEELSDGSLVAVLGEDTSGCEVETVSYDGRTMAFIGCYRTDIDRIRGKKSGSIVRIGESSEISAVYYYPTADGDVLIYGEGFEDGGVVTLPRLIYNYWLIIGLIMTAVFAAAFVVLRKKYYSGIILRAAMLALSFSISIPVCLAGRFGEVYNAAYYFTGILLVTIVIYLLLRIFLRDFLKGGWYTHSVKKEAEEKGESD